MNVEEMEAFMNFEEMETFMNFEVMGASVGILNFFVWSHASVLSSTLPFLFPPSRPGSSPL